MTLDYLDNMFESFTSWRNELEDFSAHRKLQFDALSAAGGLTA
jgi:hypothetical protein